MFTSENDPNTTAQRAREAQVMATASFVMMQSMIAWMIKDGTLTPKEAGEMASNAISALREQKTGLSHEAAEKLEAGFKTVLHAFREGG